MTRVVLPCFTMPRSVHRFVHRVKPVSGFWVHRTRYFFAYLFGDMAKGYGNRIALAREAADLTVEQLAERINRKPSTVRRLESEETEPSVEQINALVAALPLSAEVLLRDMGVHLNPPGATRLPPGLVDALLRLGPEEWRQFERLARGLSGPQQNGGRQ